MYKKEEFIKGLLWSLDYVDDGEPIVFNEKNNRPFKKLGFEKTFNNLVGNDCKVRGRSLGSEKKTKFKSILPKRKGV